MFHFGIVLQAIDPHKKRAYMISDSPLFQVPVPPNKSVSVAYNVNQRNLLFHMPVLLISIARQYIILACHDSI